APAFVSSPTATRTRDLSAPSLHDALPIWAFHLNDQHRLFVRCSQVAGGIRHLPIAVVGPPQGGPPLALRRVLGVLHQSPHLIDGDRKSTRLNSSHVKISYAVFCLKKKKMI